MRRVKLIIFGRVQGVGYRYFVQSRADKMEIKGFVRNLPDGEVEIDAEGEQSHISLFIEQCIEGSGLSKISNYYIHDIPIYGFQKFEIKYS